MKPANDNLDFDALSKLPMFATDRQIAAAIVGNGGADRWIKEVMPILERRGLPKVDALHGRRAVPLVRKFYEGYFGITAGFATAKPDGEEKLGLDQWKTRNKKAA
ncbi:hypothetical protein LB579_31880 [Mesorhizobium sp. BR1-1-7]|uniref:hypothetical protein n=1 Tax=Mesorhizobium sp. BR1-1-7 TaxID=2876647 RepID=UPI001CCADBF0|nr:hypothetical protein [Mesorhizobium sp. BR1-1-7]MBZ9922278.1 hypothetical protein [Mesorhizobium sp. BR1-1-7]